MIVSNVFRSLACAVLVGLAGLQTVAPAHADEDGSTTVRTEETVRTHEVVRSRSTRHCRCAVVASGRRSLHRRARYAASVRRGSGIPLIAASSVHLNAGWDERPVEGRHVVGPGLNPLYDRDLPAQYLGLGGSAAPVLHVPSGRGSVQQ